MTDTVQLFIAIGDGAIRGVFDQEHKYTALSKALQIEIITLNELLPEADAIIVAETDDEAEDIDSLESQIEDLEREVSEYEDQVSELESKIKRLETEKSDL